jgi:hypothetical protein
VGADGIDAVAVGFPAGWALLLKKRRRTSLGPLVRTK